MGLKKYFSKKDGKRVQLGWKAELVIDGKTIDYRLFDKDEKSKAQYWLEQRQKKIKTGEFCRKDVTLAEVFDLYMTSKRWGEITQSSRVYFQRCHKNFLRLDRKWLNLPIADISVNVLFKLLGQLKDAIERERKHLARELDFLSACIGFYRETVDHTYISPITKNHKYTYGKLARRGGKKKSNKVKKALDFNQVKFLLKNLKEAGAEYHQFEIIYYYIVRLQLIYGLRLGEVCGLEWSDVDFKKKIVRLTGTMQWFGENGLVLRNQKVYRLKEEGELDDDESIEFMMDAEVEKLLVEIKSLKRSGRWVMANKEGDVPQYSKIYKRLKRTGFFNEPGQCSHKIRKTTRTLGQILIGAKGSSDLLRHASLEVSDRYLDDGIVARHNPLPKMIAEMTN